MGDRFGAAFRTPMGMMVATASKRGLCTVSFDTDDLYGIDQDTPSPPLEIFAEFLEAYLSDPMQPLPDVPVELAGRVKDLEVWKRVREIPPGRTVTYGQLAAGVGRPSSARAVASAVGRNPMLLVVPCHRVVSSKGGLAGYSGGLQRKAWLLRHERVLLL